MSERVLEMSQSCGEEEIKCQNTQGADSLTPSTSTSGKHSDTDVHSDASSQPNTNATQCTGDEHKLPSGLNRSDGNTTSVDQGTMGGGPSNVLPQFEDIPIRSPPESDMGLETITSKHAEGASSSGDSEVIAGDSEETAPSELGLSYDPPGHGDMENHPPATPEDLKEEPSPEAPQKKDFKKISSEADHQGENNVSKASDQRSLDLTADRLEEQLNEQMQEENTFWSQEVCHMHGIQNIERPKARPFADLANVFALAAQLSYQLKSHNVKNFGEDENKVFFAYLNHVKSALKNASYGFLSPRELHDVVMELQNRNARLTESNRSKAAELRKWPAYADRVSNEAKELYEINGALQKKYDDVQQQLCRAKAGLHGSYQDGLPTPDILESEVKSVLAAISKFCRMYSAYKSPDKVVPAQIKVEQATVWKVRTQEQTHWKHMLRAYVCDILFDNFENEKFVSNRFETENFMSNKRSTMFLDPDDRVRDCASYIRLPDKDNRLCGTGQTPSSHVMFDVLFGEFYLNRSRLILPTEMYELSKYFTIFGEMCNPEAQALRSDGDEKAWKLVDFFIQTARKVWKLHKLCLAFDPPATIFRVAHGDKFNPLYMEPSADELPPDEKFVPAVGVMTMPGFRLRKSVMKCQIYFDDKNEASRSQPTIDPIENHTVDEIVKPLSVG